MKNIMNTMNLVKKAQEVQAEIASIQRQLAEQSVTGKASNGAVQVTMTGKMVPQAVKIQPDLLQQVDAETLEDLIFMMQLTSQLIDGGDVKYHSIHIWTKLLK